MIQGNFNARCTEFQLGTKRDGRPVVRATMTIVGGEHDGQRVAYEGNFSEKAVRWTRRNLTTLGWKGKTILTAKDDILSADLTVPIEVEIAKWEDPSTGKLREWSAVRRIGEGGGELKPIESEQLRDVNRWLAEADEGSPAAAVEDDIPF